DGARVARVDPAERRLDARARRLEIARLEQAHVDAVSVVRRTIDLALEIVGLEEGLPAAPAQRVERDAQGDHAEPRVDATVLPLEAVEALDDARVRVGERVLGGRLRAEPG